MSDQPTPPRPPVLLRSWVFFLVTALAVLAGAGAHLLTRSERWSAQAIVAFVPVGTRPVSAASAQLMVPRYVAYATSPYVVRQVAVSVGQPAADLQHGLTVTMPATTTNVAITVVGANRAASALAANRIAALVIERAAADPVLAGRLLADAPMPTTPAGPSRMEIGVGAVVAALALGALAAFGARWYVRCRYPWTVGGAISGAPPRRRPAPATGSAVGSVPRPNPDQIGSTYPRSTDEHFWTRRDALPATAVLPAADALAADDRDELTDTVQMPTIEGDTLESDTLAFEESRK